MSAALKQAAQALKGLDLDGMVEAFYRVIEAHAAKDSPFHNPVNADAQMALRVLRGLVPCLRALEAEPQQDKLDAERWRETLMRVGATRTEWVGGGHMFIVNLKPPSNVMRGSVAQHFTEVIDAARKAQP